MQRRRERSFEVSLAVLSDLAATESAPVICQYGLTCASACHVEPMPAALASFLGKKRRKKRSKALVLTL